MKKTLSQLASEHIKKPDAKKIAHKTKSSKQYWAKYNALYNNIQKDILTGNPL